VFDALPTSATVRVWRPASNTDLELYLCENTDVRIERLFTQGYYLSYGMQGGAEVEYAGIHKGALREAVFQVINPETFVSGSPLHERYSFRSVHISTSLMRRLSASVLDADTPLLEMKFLASSADAASKLNQLVYQTVELHHQSATSLQRDAVLLELVARCVEYQAFQKLPTFRGTQELGAVRRAREFLLDHVGDEVRLDALAAVSGLHPHYLIQAFRRVFGIAPHQFQLQLRIQRATTELILNDSIAEIAYRLGFADQSHFSRVFKRFVGVTPARYRAESTT
jgi:AraC-like DNA-binding protein